MSYDPRESSTSKALIASGATEPRQPAVPASLTI
jgi:hypothetical protein